VLNKISQTDEDEYGMFSFNVECRKQKMKVEGKF
jgi:hypothetical protein